MNTDKSRFSASSLMQKCSDVNEEEWQTQMDDVNRKLVETGERERIKELLRARLAECGWKDQIKLHCRKILEENVLENRTVDDLVSEVTPRGRALVPDQVKKELLQRITAFFQQSLD